MWCSWCNGLAFWTVNPEKVGSNPPEHPTKKKFLVDSTLGERARLLTGEGGFETHSTSQ